MYHILLNSDNEIVKTNLAPFICNNFYCNYLSGNYMENNLLYIITKMLKDEIDKLENINQVDTFLENTKCGFLLEELRKMPDVQIYFKNVILKTVEKIETHYSYKEIKFKVSEILKDLMKFKEDEEKKATNKNKNIEDIFTIIIDSKTIDLSINFSREENKKKCNMKNEIFIKNYVPNLTLNHFKERAENAKKENKTNLYEYFNQIQDNIKSNKNEEIYANDTIMKKMLDTNLPSYSLAFYLNDFLEVISFIEQLIEDLMNNILLLPNSIKYICKIISILIKQKFKNITKCEENAFISKFVIEKLLIPIISFPSFNALTNDFVISGNTIKNVKIINFILKKLFSGKLFLNNMEEGDYTPFNWFFIDKIEQIFYFFEKTTNTNLPDFIEKYVNDELPKDYSYDFFNENKEQICAYISTCFNLSNLKYLIKGLRKSEYLFKTDNPKIKKLEKVYKRLKSENFEYINENQENEKTKISPRESLKKNVNIIENKMNKENYFIYNELVIEEKYNNLFNINNKIANFYIDLKKQKDIILDVKETNIIKVKNYLCRSLGNFRLLNKSDFNIGTTSDTKKLLNQIKIYMSLPNFILNNNNIPSIWYINSILDYLNKIPEDYKKNDYKKLFVELTQNLNESINHLDFEKLIIFRNKLKFIDKMSNYYDNVNKLIDNILINENIKHIVEDMFIPVDINFNYDDNKKIFKLNRSNIKEKNFEDKILYEDSKKKEKTFRTIEAFTRYFPNLMKYQINQDINPIDIIKELSINKEIENYFKIIEEKIINKEIIEKNQYQISYKEKIKDYIMNKIYEKIYPPEPDEKDMEIFKKTMSLSWVEPNLIFKKDYIFDNILPDILNEFKQINIIKSPYQKLDSIKKIFKLIDNIIIFNEGEEKEIGLDDITPVLNYVSIKAHPFRINTDINFIKIFSYCQGEFEKNLISLEGVYDFILNCNADTFKMSQTEFYEKCLGSFIGAENGVEYINK